MLVVLVAGAREIPEVCGEMERRWVRSEGMDSQGMSRLCDKKTSYGEGMYTRVYIYICIDISSWCILPRLKVEHIITHLDRYGVDCKKKQ